MDNKELQQKYDEMHIKGPTSWFSDGQEERKTIIKMGEPWKGKKVLEIGCGEGDLLNMILNQGADAQGVDYSQEAINKARQYIPMHLVVAGDYRKVQGQYDRIVMQGVLEHLDDPFTELQWMIDHLLAPGGDIITSSPCFDNPRGIVWMTLNMLGAVMSKTDLHYLTELDFLKFCAEKEYEIDLRECDYSWGNAQTMIADLSQRIPLALKDGNIPFNQDRLDALLKWLEQCSITGAGATTVYHIMT